MMKLIKDSLDHPVLRRPDRPVTAMAKTYKWDMANEYPPTSIHGENDQYFIKVLEELRRRPDQRSPITPEHPWDTNPRTSSMR